MIDRQPRHHQASSFRQTDPSVTGSFGNERQIDSAVDVVTPENIAFKYNVAGPFRRLCAFLVDTAIIVGSLLLLLLLFLLIGTLFGVLFNWLLGPTPEAESAMNVVGAVLQGSYLVLWFSSYWSFGALFETFWNGQTPGKRMLGIRVVGTDGQPINGMQAVLRNILRAADSFPLLSPAIFAGTFIGAAIEETMSGGGDPVGGAPTVESLSHYTVIPTFMVGLIFMMCNRRFLRVGDIVCGTMVVLEERSWLVGVARIDDARTPQLAALIPASFQVSRGLARAVATYVERRRFFSAPRRREMARHLGEPLLRDFGLPPDTSHDLLLCALYYRTFVTDRDDDYAFRDTMPYGASYATAYGANPAADGINFLGPPAEQPNPPKIVIRL